jgi:hypothetical protein
MTASVCAMIQSRGRRGRIPSEDRSPDRVDRGYGVARSAYGPRLVVLKTICLPLTSSTCRISWSTTRDGARPSPTFVCGRGRAVAPNIPRGAQRPTSTKSSCSETVTLRSIRLIANEVPGALSEEFATLYAKDGRRSRRRGAAGDAAADGILRRDRAILIAALGVSTALAWIDLVWFANDMAMYGIGGDQLPHDSRRPGYDDALRSLKGAKSRRKAHTARQTDSVPIGAGTG